MAHKKRKKVGEKLPTDKEIAEGIKEIAQWWLTTPGVPVGMSPQSPLWEPLFGSQTTIPVTGTPLTQTPWVPPGTVVPEFLRQAISDLQFPGQTDRRTPLPQRKPPRPRTPKQKKNDEIQSTAFTEANKMARKKNGSFKKGWDQRRVAMMAQKKCTKERERLGLCKRKRKRGSRSR